jgi:hypothetical protein
MLTPSKKPGLVPISTKIQTKLRKSEWFASNHFFSLPVLGHTKLNTF